MKIQDADILELGWCHVYETLADGDPFTVPNYWQLYTWLKEKRKAQVVTVPKGQSTVRYDLANVLFKQNLNSEAKHMNDIVTHTMACLKWKLCYLRDIPYVQIKQAFKLAIYNKVYSEFLYDVKEVEPENNVKLQLVSEIPRYRTRKRKVKAITPFFVELKKKVTETGKFLRKTELGRELISFVRNFYQTAKDLSLGRRLYKGFIFSFSHSKFCKKYGYKKSHVNRLINLAAGLGLITKITPEEGKGIGEYWHKRFSVGTLQFKLLPIKTDLIKRRWQRWLNSKIKLHDLTLAKIKEVLGCDINTHPEAKDLNLRKVIKESIKRATIAQEEVTRKEKYKIKVILEDPFKIGHKGKRYNCDITRKYTVKEARTIIADIIQDHNNSAVCGWTDINKLDLDTVVTYKVKEKGKYVKHRTGTLDKLPTGLLIPECYFCSARKHAKTLISELYNQGLIGLVTETSTLIGQREHKENWSTKEFLLAMNMIRQPRRRKVETKKDSDFLFDIIDDMFLDRF